MEPDEPQLSHPSQSIAAAPEALVEQPTGDGVPVEGDFIGRYRVRERIGEGGMGLVYAAEDRQLGRLVAIKLLRSVEGASADIHRRRLLREAQALARVSHRNLVMVFDVGTHEGRVWIAMERVIGDTLEDWLAAQPRPWEDIVDVFMEAGRGLVAVHEAGLVHRDFKPGNVIVRGDGTVQVLDFGLAAEAGEKLEPGDTDEPRAQPALDALAATLTETGGIMGTPAYMAPEQFLGLGADARSDQFSFCVALYEALHGERPFKGRDLPELMMATVEGLPDLPPELPGVPDLLRRSIARGLQPDPESRFPDLEALLFALERSRAPAPPTREADWRRFALGVVVGGGLLALGVGAWVSTWEDEQTLEPEPEVLLITAPMGELPDVVVPEPEPEPTPASRSPQRESPDAEADGRGAALPGVEELDPPRTKGGTDGPAPTRASEPSQPKASESDRRAGHDTPSTSANLPGPVASPVDSDPSTEPPNANLVEPVQVEPPKSQPRPADPDPDPEPLDADPADTPEPPSPKPDARDTRTLEDERPELTTPESERAGEDE
jgi:serine/threonine protein kinase